VRVCVCVCVCVPLSLSLCVCLSVGQKNQSLRYKVRRDATTDWRLVIDRFVSAPIVLPRPFCGKDRRVSSDDIIVNLLLIPSSSSVIIIISSSSSVSSCSSCSRRGRHAQLLRTAALSTCLEQLNALPLSKTV